MGSKLTTLSQLRQAALGARALSAQVAAAAAEAIGELAGSAVTLEQMDAAIQAAISDAVEEAY